MFSSTQSKHSSVSNERLHNQVPFCFFITCWFLESIYLANSSTMSCGTVKKELGPTVLSENLSDDNVSSVAALLESWKTELDDLKDVVNDILEATDYESKTDKKVEVLETEISREYINRKMDYSAPEGGVQGYSPKITLNENICFAPFIRYLFCRRFTHQPIVQITRHTVPKFEGDIKNFTKWYSLFEATINSNDHLKPVQKLYFLKQAMVGVMPSICYRIFVSKTKCSRAFTNF